MRYFDDHCTMFTYITGGLWWFCTAKAYVSNVVLQVVVAVCEVLKRQSVKLSNLSRYYPHKMRFQSLVPTQYTCCLLDYNLGTFSFLPLNFLVASR